MLDFAGAYKLTGPWGYARTAGILRRIEWDDNLADRFDLSGNATGWGCESQLEPEDRQGRHPAGCSSRSVKAFRTK